MGKKSRKKYQADKLALKKKSVKPDDYFRMGPIEFARFGTMVVGRSNMSSEQFGILQEKLVKRFPVVCREIDEKISKIVKAVKELSPGELLKRAHWEMAAHHLNMASESDGDYESAISLRMVDYLQSIIVSVEPAETIQHDISDERWMELRKLVGDLFAQVNNDYQFCRTAYERKNNPDYDKDFDEYLFKAQLYWCNVRGHRYLYHEIPFFRDVLSPHDDVLEELFGINSKNLIESIQKIQDSLTLGIGELMEELHEFQHVTTTELEKKIRGVKSLSEKDLPDIMDQVIKENNWESWRDSVFGRLDGLDLFDLEKISNLPEPLLDELSWEPDQDTEFLKEGDYKGWPLRIWPIFKRPFIKLNGRYYCFELYSLFDNFYRSLQRIIIRKKPDYHSEWNKKQQNISEQIPFELFKYLLPGAQIYQSVYYRWHTGQKGVKQWCEADGLVFYHDHLFIIEVKAGAFTYTPPATDFPAYIASLKNLVFKPAEQGARFLNYLKSDDVVDIFDKNHNCIAKMSESDFEHTTICAVTLDPFTELAAQVEHLKKIGIDVGDHFVWSISIDDLRVYADIFDNPLVFLHFVEQRSRAYQSNLVKTEDELDHLGLYLKHNVYSQYVSELNLNGKLNWHGYRTNIDRYFTNKLHDSSSVAPLKQGMPARLREIINHLAECCKADCRKVASILLDCSGEWRKNLTDGINDILIIQSNTGRAKPLSTYGGIGITMFCWQQNILDRNEKLALEHTRAAMLITQDKGRLLLEITYDEAGILKDVDYKYLRIKDIPEEEIKHLLTLAAKLRSKRLETAAQSQEGKIGRNQPCPCGSGKKYKKCCYLLKS